MKKSFLLSLLTVISCLFAITVSTTLPSLFLSPKPLMAQEVVQTTEGTYRKIPNQANQDDSWTCGANSASRVLKYYGHNVSYPQVRGVAQKDHGIIPTKVCVGGKKCAWGVCVPLPKKCFDTSQFKTGLEPDEVRSLLSRWEGGNAKLSTRTSFEELKARVREGKPVITLKRVGSFKPGGGILGTWPEMHWVTVHGLSESAQKIYYTDTSDNSAVSEQRYSEFLSEWDWSIGDGLANETIWGKGVRPKTMVWVDKNPPAIATQPNPSVRFQLGFYSRVGMNPPGIIYLWPSPWDGGKTDVWCNVPNHSMYVRNLNNIGSAIEVNSLETVTNTGKYWSQPCTDDVFQQSRVQH